MEPLCVFVTDDVCVPVKVPLGVCDGVTVRCAVLETEGELVMVSVAVLVLESVA